MNTATSNKQSKRIDTEDIIVIMSYIIGLLTNTILCLTHFWVGLDIKSGITIWVFVPAFIAYLIYKLAWRVVNR